MGSHRKPPSTGLRGLSAAGLAPAVGITTAALTSVALLASTAQAAPSKPGGKPSIEEVQKKVDSLYHQAEVATQKYNAAKERAATQRGHVDHLLDDIAERTQKLHDARRSLGALAAAQYRSGGLSGTATLLLADDPQQYFDDNHLMDRLTDRQKSSVDDFEKQQAATAKKRVEASRSLQNLTKSQKSLKKNKEDVQKKLTAARKLLSHLNAQEKARLAAIQKKKEEAARRKARELARQQAEAAKKQESGGGTTSGGGSHTGLGAQAVAFAKAQIGKPYVWGATGPGSFDCSGLTQAAWKSAGVSLPRTTWDQVKAGTTVSASQAQPGDLVFYYSDISHVGIYVGGGNVIDAPKPGESVRTIPMTYMPIHSVVRPA